MRGTHFVSGMAAFLLFAPLYRTQAQERSASPKIEFEVASVRPIVPPSGGGNPCNVNSKPLNLSRNISGNRFTMARTTLAGLIRDTYNVRDDQFTGLPGWATCTDQYEINAKAPGEAIPSPEQVQLMLQALLADRFQLRLHHDTKNLTVYEPHHRQERS